MTAYTTTQKRRIAAHFPHYEIRFMPDGSVQGRRHEAESWSQVMGADTARAAARGA